MRYALALLFLLPAISFAEPMTIVIVGGSDSPNPPENVQLEQDIERATVWNEHAKTDIHTKANVPLDYDVPSGWTAPTPPAIQPAPPSSTAPQTGWASCPSTCNLSTLYPTQQAACAVNHPEATPNVFSSPGGIPTWTCRRPPGLGEGTTQFRSVCVTGYTLSGSNCVLSNASLVQKPSDGKCSVIRSGNTFSGDTRDPDCGTTQLTNARVTVSSDETNVQDSKGTVKAKINPDGTTTITYNKYNASSSTTSQTTIALDSNGKVIGKSNQTFQGVGTGLQGDSPLGKVDIDLPDDYNREATQQQILDALKCDDCTVPEDVTEEQKAQIEEEVQKSVAMLEEAESDYDNYKTYFDWPDWVPSFPSGSCSPFTGSVRGLTISWDMCPHIAMFNELIGWLYALFAAWSTLSLFWRND